MVQVEIDLMNPEDLLHKMEMLQLTEDECEDLLKQAYSINRKLKSKNSAYFLILLACTTLTTKR